MDTIDLTPAPLLEASKKSAKAASTASPPKTATPSPKVVDAPTTESIKKAKPLKIAEAKAVKWIDNLKKAQAVSNNKHVAMVLTNLENIVSIKNGAGTRNANRTLSEYNVFVQQNIKQVAAQHPNMSNKEIMIKIAEMWQSHKTSVAKQ